MNYQLYFYAASALGLILVAINIVQNGMNNKLRRQKEHLNEALADYMEICDKQLDKIESYKQKVAKNGTKVASLSRSIKARDRKIELLTEESKHYMGKMFYREDIIDAERAKHKLEVDRLKEELYAFYELTKKKAK